MVIAVNFESGKEEEIPGGITHALCVDPAVDPFHSFLSLSPVVSVDVFLLMCLLVSYPFLFLSKNEKSKRNQ